MDTATFKHDTEKRNLFLSTKIKVAIATLCFLLFFNSFSLYSQVQLCPVDPASPCFTTPNGCVGTAPEVKVVSTTGCELTFIWLYSCNNGIIGAGEIDAAGNPVVFYACGNGVDPNCPTELPYCDDCIQVGGFNPFWTGYCAKITCECDCEYPIGFKLYDKGTATQYTIPNSGTPQPVVGFPCPSCPNGVQVSYVATTKTYTFSCIP